MFINGGMVRYAWLEIMLNDRIVKKTEMIVKKSHGYQDLEIFKIYIFYIRCLFCDGGCFEKRGVICAD